MSQIKLIICMLKTYKLILELKGMALTMYPCNNKQQFEENLIKCIDSKLKDLQE